MSGRRSIVLLGIIALIGVFAVAFHHVFESSFEHGEMYPEHSTMRADPRGAMILFETLEAMDDVEAIRWHEPFKKWQEEGITTPEQTTLILLDAYNEDLQSKAIKNFVVRGGRLVVSLQDLSNWDDEANEEHQADDHSEDEKSEDVEESTPDDADEKQTPSISHLLASLSIKFDAGFFTDRATLSSSDSIGKGAPSSITWHADGYLTDNSGEDQSPTWQTLYSVNNRAVIVGQQVGRGQVIVLADGLPLTNESMFGNPDYSFLKWLLGNRANIVFDEYHFGIVKPRGIAMLIRQYNLELTVLALLTSFFLFIWHGAMPLMSAEDTKLRDDPNRQTVISGYRDLLRRYMSSKNILLVCLDEWKSVFMARKSDQARYANQFAEAQSIAVQEMKKPKKQRNLAYAYQTMTSILNQRRHKP